MGHRCLKHSETRSRCWCKKKQVKFCFSCRNKPNFSTVGCSEAFDRHMNLVLENAREMWTEVQASHLVTRSEPFESSFRILQRSPTIMIHSSTRSQTVGGAKRIPLQARAREEKRKEQSTVSSSVIWSTVFSVFSKFQRLVNGVGVQSGKAWKNGCIKSDFCVQGVIFQLFSSFTFFPLHQSRIL